MTTELIASDFENLRGHSFTITSTNPNVTLELIEIESKNSSLREGGAFALTWKGSVDSILEQGTYTFTHKEMEPTEIFIVPIGPDDEGCLYEAVFA